MGDQFLPGMESFKQPFSTAQSDPNIGLFTNQFLGINPVHHHTNIHALTGFPLDRNLFPDSPGFFLQDNDSPVLPAPVPPLNDQVFKNQAADKKRKATEISTPENSPANSSPQGSDSGNNVRRRKGSGRGKKAKGNETEENPREVVHVRAKRGQATDSHSLAERVRREKINERLRCLQDIVPGCYKTMGMAVMLDEIINYVQSLQNQVEFLSMKLTAASTFYDFNSETDALEAMQRAKAFQAIKFQNGASQGLTPAQLAAMCLNSGSYPQLPHGK